MFSIHRIENEDIGRIADLEAQIFLDAWSAHAIQETFRQRNAIILGAYYVERLIGYVIFYYVPDEGDIVRIAADEGFRRQGAASRLLEGLEAVCREEGVVKLMLEVRESNDAAVSFYKNCGFIQDGVRKNFYKNPTEDGILMSLKLESNGRL